MKKVLDTHCSIPTSKEASADKVVVRIGVSLVVGALALSAANIAKNNVVDTMNDNMGKSIYNQITGEDKSVSFVNALEEGSVELPVQFYGVDSHKQDK
jgi:hypothetical protein